MATFSREDVLIIGGGIPALIGMGIGQILLVAFGIAIASVGAVMGTPMGE